MMSRTQKARAHFSRRNMGFSALLLVLLGLAAQRLFDGFGELLWRSALDLTTRTAHVQRWFSGQEFYGVKSSTYPPASHLILWPLLGWLPFEMVRRLWAILIVFSLGWLMRWCAHALDGYSRLEQGLVAALLLAMTATGRAIFLGQLTPLVFASITMALSLVTLREGEKVGWRRETLAAFLMLFALVKPSVSVPFLWLLLWSSARARTTVFVVLGYAALTLAALWFQNDGIGEISTWAETVNRNQAQISEGYANLRVWVAGLGFKPWSHPLSLAVLGWLGWWTHRHRRAEMWLLLGVIGCVARGWTYHASYDDMLLILPAIALFRIARDDKIGTTHCGMKNEAGQSRFLLIALVLTLLIPTPWIWNVSWLGVTVQSVSSIVWLLVLVFLLRFARRCGLAAS